MNCTYHPDKEADGVCSSCGRPFCRACMVESAGKSYCRPCAATAIGQNRQGASDMAVGAIILSAASIGLCGFTAIPGMILGFIELGRIKRGESPEAGRGMAKAAAIIGVVMTALMMLAILATVIITIIGIVIAMLTAGS